MEVHSNLAAVMAAIEREARIRLTAAGNTVRNEWLQTLSGDRSGRTYRVPGRKVTYVASAPGEAPAQRNGDLRRSIAVHPATGEVIACEVGSHLTYAVWLEKGTKRIAARPHLSPTLDKALPKVKAALVRKWVL